MDRLSVPDWLGTTILPVWLIIPPPTAEELNRVAKGGSDSCVCACVCVCVLWCVCLRKT